MNGKKLDPQIVCDLYQKLQRCDYVARVLECHPRTVGRVLKQHGVEVSRHGWHTCPPKRKYSLNESRILVHDAEFFYFLGFLMCDGYVTRNRNSHVIGLSVAEQDADIVEKFAKFLGTNKPVLHDAYPASKSSVLNKRSPVGQRLYYMARLDIYSQFIYEHLGSWGMVQNKTHILELRKDIPEGYMRDFIRGCLDADGNISDKQKRCYICSSSKRFLDQLSAMILSQTGIKMIDTTNGAGCCLIKAHGLKCVNLLCWLYGRSDLFLNRKMRLAEKLYYSS